MHLNFYRGHWWLNAGWYSGEEFRLFDFGICNACVDANNKVGLVEIFGIQVAYFMIRFGWQRLAV